ncbi:MAG: hypothetical protein KGO92_03420 [Bacteroidota bacterium]|nr:hypothetical protein [Bacteroidota bacterium]
MKPIRTLVFVFIPVFIILLSFIVYAWKQNEQLQDKQNTAIIQIDSLRAENKMLNTQLSYLKRYYDSTRKKIPEPTGFAFITDSISDQGK